MSNTQRANDTCSCVGFHQLPCVLLGIAISIGLRLWDYMLSNKEAFSVVQ